MRPLLKLLAAAATVVTLTGTILLTLLAARIGAVAGKARPQPQSITLADLIKNGPGDNLHVTLSEFSFGAPVEDKFADQWEGAWVPLYPGRRTDGTPPALFYSRRTNSRAELDEILKQESLNALVASSLSDSALKFEPAAQVYTAFPKLDPQKTVVLTEPVLGLRGDTVLPPERWFSSTISYLSWGAALGMLGLGIFCAYTSYRLNRKSEEEAAEELAPVASKVVGPADPNVISVHRFTLKRSYFIIYALGFAMTAMFFIGGVLLHTAVRLASEKMDGAPLLIGLLGLLMSGGGIALAVKLLLDYRFTIREVAVLHGGLRWLRNKRTYNAAWNDIKSVFKKDVIYVTVGSGTRSGHINTLTLRLNDGRVLRFNKDTLEDYDRFAENVQRIHTHFVVQQKQRELAETGAATFGPIAVRADGIAIGRKQLPWSDLERFEVADGHLKFHAPKAFSFWQSNAIPLYEIPNYVALFEMLRPKAVAH